MRFFICGSALRGQPDHKNLGDARFVREAATASNYRLHSIKNGWHPGIYEVATGGIAIEGEVYELTEEQHRHLLAGEPPDMYEAPIVLDDGSTVSAMFYPRELIERDHEPDISHFGSWARYKQQSRNGPSMDSG
jgi:gamma-glutamylaminecyclotransferase